MKSTSRLFNAVLIGCCSYDDCCSDFWAFHSLGHPHGLAASMAEAELVGPEVSFTIAC